LPSDARLRICKSQDRVGTAPEAIAPFARNPVSPAFQPAGGGGNWDVAVNVGTNDADDLLKYKFAFDFRHTVIQTLAAAPAGSHELTGQAAFPALDFMRSDLLANTGSWHDSDVMDGSDFPEPAASLKRLLSKARQQDFDVYVFGRFFSEGDGIHDTHMNQGSTRSFIFPLRAAIVKPENPRVVARGNQIGEQPVDRNQRPDI
jgi:hypothetical protein